MPRELFNNAELSFAAYATLIAGNTDSTDNEFALLDEQLTQVQFESFAERYPTVLNQFNDNNSGFSVTVFQSAPGSPPDDGEHPDTIGGQAIRFWDADKEEIFAGGNSTGQGGRNTVDSNTVTNILLGNDQSDSFIGRALDDRLYGLAGNNLGNVLMVRGEDVSIYHAFFLKNPANEELYSEVM